LIAVAAKLKENEAHGARRGRFLRFWSGARRNRSAKRTAERERRDRPVMHERFQAKLEATIWPD
jgi:hypothetical protein